MEFFLKLHDIVSNNEDKKLKHGNILQAMKQIKFIPYNYAAGYRWVDTIKKKNNIHGIHEVTKQMLEDIIESMAYLVENNRYRLILNPNTNRMLPINQ